MKFKHHHHKKEKESGRAQYQIPRDYEAVEQAGEKDHDELPPSRPSPQRRPTLDLVRERAYHMWLEAGSPPSDGREFWLRAEAELNSLTGEYGHADGRDGDGKD